MGVSCLVPWPLNWAQSVSGAEPSITLMDGFFMLMLFRNAPFLINSDGIVVDFVMEISSHG